MTAETIVETPAVLEVQRGLHKLKSGDFSGALKHSVSALELCSTPHEVYEASMCVLPPLPPHDHFDTWLTGLLSRTLVLRCAVYPCFAAVHPPVLSPPSLIARCQDPS